MNTKKCFVCGRRLGKNPCRVDTLEDQWVFIGSECYRFVKSAGETGYQPPKGGPRLYPLTRERINYFCDKGLL